MRRSSHRQPRTILFVFPDCGSGVPVCHHVTCARTHSFAMRLPVPFSGLSSSHGCQSSMRRGVVINMFMTASPSATTSSRPPWRRTWRNMTASTSTVSSAHSLAFGTLLVEATSMNKGCTLLASMSIVIGMKLQCSRQAYLSLFVHIICI